MTDRTVKDVNRRLMEEARERARAHFLNSRLTGAWTPDPDVARWPKIFRKAFEVELARLEGGGTVG